MQTTTRWLCDFRARLPDLKTSSERVRKVQLTYLNRLIELGVGGFRYDAAVNMEVETLRWFQDKLPDDVYHFGEVVGTSREEVLLYSAEMPVTDFRLLIEMTRAFAPAGDLHSLLPERIAGRVVPAPRRVAFVRNHDADKNPDFLIGGISMRQRWPMPKCCLGRRERLLCLTVTSDGRSFKPVFDSESALKMHRSISGVLMFLVGEVPADIDS